MGYLLIRCTILAVDAQDQKSERIKELRSSGASVAEIASCTGRSRRSVKSAIERMIDLGDVPPKTYPWAVDEIRLLSAMSRERKPVEEIAEYLGRTKTAVLTKASRLSVVRRPRWTADDDRILLSMSDTHEAVAAALGRSVLGVIRRRQRLAKRMVIP